jgi:hypothetical protein
MWKLYQWKLYKEMNDHQKIKHLSEKIGRLLESVEKNNGRFSSIDKDLLTNYVRELYEMIVSVDPQSAPVTSAPAENKMLKSSLYSNNTEPKLKDEKQEVNGNGHMNGDEIISSPKEIFVKKTISQMYAEKSDSGKSTVNDKFKKQGLEIADKLTQTPIKDLKGYIGLNKQFAFMSKLFNADEQLYEEAIARLNTFKTYEEATGYIQSELLPAYHWNNEEPLVGEFFTLVMRRYLK